MSYKPGMHTMRCTVHGVHFASEQYQKSPMPPACCYCLEEKLARARTDLAAATQHRDALLRAIEIKQLFEPVLGAG